jgi:IS5 family transposase
MELAALLDWAENDRELVGISAEAKDELGWSPLALYRALLRTTWHDLSAIRLAEALEERERGPTLGAVPSEPG